MPVAAVPAYLGNDFKDASPGMCFGMLLPIWTSRKDQEKEVKTRAEAGSREGQEINGLLQRLGMDETIRRLRDEAYCRQNRLKPLPKLWAKNDFAARQAWNAIKALNPRDRAQMANLAVRQCGLAATVPADSLLRLEATAISPFTTGLGNEHPLENGFAFLNPYGLPYLAGSGVKGVLRKAAQELAAGLWGDSRGWSEQAVYQIDVGTKSKPRWLALSMIDVLFGREPPPGDGDHVRGALTFWDVIPLMAGDSLMVEIMTPHQSHYYQQKRERKSGDSVSPHDSGQPNPIAFLTVPPGSTFAFHVVCDEHHLERLTQNRPNGPDLLQKGSDGKPLWQKLIETAFEHAFQWLGFGAKTVVGYGAMQARAARSEEKPATSDAGDRSPARPAAAESSRTPVWDNAKLTWKPGPQELTAAKDGKVSAPVKGAAEAAKLFQDPAAFERLKKKGELKGVRVELEVDGNRLTLKRILG